MTLGDGAYLGHDRILGPLGTGGIAGGYRAEDGCLGEGIERCYAEATRGYRRAADEGVASGPNTLGFVVSTTGDERRVPGRALFHNRSPVGQGCSIS